MAFDAIRTEIMRVLLRRTVQYPTPATLSYGYDAYDVRAQMGAGVGRGAGGGRGRGKKKRRKDPNAPKRCM